MSNFIYINTTVYKLLPTNEKINMEFTRLSCYFILHTEKRKYFNKGYTYLTRSVTTQYFSTSILHKVALHSLPSHRFTRLPCWHYWN